MQITVTELVATIREERPACAPQAEQLAATWLRRLGYDASATTVSMVDAGWIVDHVQPTVTSLSARRGLARGRRAARTRTRTTGGAVRVVPLPAA